MFHNQTELGAARILKEELAKAPEAVKQQILNAHAQRQPAEKAQAGIEAALHAALTFNDKKSKMAEDKKLVKFLAEEFPDKSVWKAVRQWASTVRKFRSK